MKLWGPLVRLARASTSSRWVLNPQKGKSSKRISATCAIAIFLTFCLFSMSNLSENIFRHLPTFFLVKLIWIGMHNCIVRLGFWNSMRKVNFEEFFKDSISRYFWGGEFCFKVLNTFRVTWDISSFSPIFTERKDHVTCNLNVQKTRWHYLQQKKGEENVSIFFCNTINSIFRSIWIFCKLENFFSAHPPKEFRSHLSKYFNDRFLLNWGIFDNIHCIFFRKKKIIHLLCQSLPYFPVVEFWINIFSIWVFLMRVHCCCATCVKFSLTLCF